MGNIENITTWKGHDELHVLASPTAIKVMFVI